MLATAPNTSPTFGWNGGNRFRRDSKQSRTSFIRRKRVPALEGKETRESDFYSPSSSSSSSDIILPPTSSDLEINSTSILFNPLSAFPSKDENEEEDDSITISPHTPLARKYNLGNKKEEEPIYLCTTKTIVSSAPVVVECEQIPFDKLPLIAQQNPTHKISWSKRTSNHAIIETYMPPTCTTCLRKLDEKSKRQEFVEQQQEKHHLQIPPQESILFSPLSRRLDISAPSSPISSGTSSASSTSDFSPYQNALLMRDGTESWGIAI